MWMQIWAAYDIIAQERLRYGHIRGYPETQRLRYLRFFNLLLDGVRESWSLLHPIRYLPKERRGCSPPH